ERRLRVHREFLDHREVIVDAAQLVGHTHAHAILDETWTAFGVERDQVERRADLAGGVVGPRRRVLEKPAEHRLRAAGHFRTADAGRRQRPAHALDREVVQLVELVAPRLRLLPRQWIATPGARADRPAPVADIRL